MLKVLYHRAKFGEARISPAARASKNVEFFCLSVGLSVCLTITLLNDRVSAYDFAVKLLEYITLLITLGSGRFAVVHRCSTFSDCRQLATPQNAEVQKNAKIWDFCLQRETKYTGDTTFWSVSVDLGSAVAHHIWPSSVKGGQYRSPQLSKFA